MQNEKRRPRGRPRTATPTYNYLLRMPPEAYSIACKIADTEGTSMNATLVRLIVAAGRYREMQGEAKIESAAA